MQSQNTSSPLYEVQVERQVAIPMADGTILRADVYRPSTLGRYPVLIERVAYELAGRCRYETNLRHPGSSAKLMIRGCASLERHF